MATAGSVFAKTLLLKQGGLWPVMLKNVLFMLLSNCNA